MGTADHIKNKFGKGFEIEVRMKPKMTKGTFKY